MNWHHRGFIINAGETYTKANMLTGIDVSIEYAGQYGV